MNSLTVLGKTIELNEHEAITLLTAVDYGALNTNPARADAIAHMAMALSAEMSAPDMLRLCARFKAEFKEVVSAHKEKLLRELPPESRLRIHDLASMLGIKQI